MSDLKDNRHLTEFVLHLADNNLILGQRLGAWCGHGPVLEQDIAITNISLDLVGQSRLYYQYAAELLNDGRDEDDLAFLRYEHQFYNNLLVEQPNGDWGMTIIRQFFYDAFHLPLLQQMMTGKNEHLAAIAEKSLKEVRYHLKYSSEWTVRLGDGTEESHKRMQRAVNELYRFTEEQYEPVERDKVVSDDLGLNWEEIRNSYKGTLDAILSRAGLEIPENAWMQKGGKSGVHSEHMGYILAEMQHMQRAYPGVKW